MKSIQKKALAAAVVATFGIGSAEAVYQNPDGTGQVLYYPYYTVQQVGGKSMNTLITVVNTTSRAKVAKVRFREGKASKEVLDFNLYLSPNDVWTAAVVPASADASSAGRLLSFDKSCTNPAIPAGGVDFRNFAYAGSAADGLGSDLARTREGYLEILELATLGGSAATSVTHNSAGVPANCKYVQTAKGDLPDEANDIKAPTGGLAGTGTIINVAQGSDIGYNAVALADCFRTGSQPTLGNETGNITACAGDSLFTVMTLDPAQRNNETPLTVAAGFVDNAPFIKKGVDAVSSTLMAQSVINEFILDGFTKSNTDWVLTFPTRRYYHSSISIEQQIASFGGFETFVARPFTNYFTTDGLCEGVEITYFNREEASAVAAVSDFSPQPIKDGASVCWEANVVSFRSGQAHHPSGLTSAVLGSKNTTPLSVGTFENGWAEIKFVGYVYGDGSADRPYLRPNTVTTFDRFGAAANPSPTSFAGLPVIGFMARSFSNSVAGAGSCDVVPCNYNASFGHKFKRRVDTSTTGTGWEVFTATSSD